jgi:hypothetical protein
MWTHPPLLTKLRQCGLEITLTSAARGIRNLKNDNRVDRCWLKGQAGDALQTML